MRASGRLGLCACPVQTQGLCDLQHRRAGPRLSASEALGAEVLWQVAPETLLTVHGAWLMEVAGMAPLSLPYGLGN